MKNLGLHLLALILVLVAATSAYRLPTNVIPLSYNVHLNISRETLFTDTRDDYEGYIIITIRATEGNLTEFQLHAASDFINITSAFYNSNPIDGISVDPSTDIVTFSNFSATLPTINTALVYITFTSRLSTQDMYGFYKSSYLFNSNTVYLATTQFQPTYARRAFPCFDEPAFKAVFDIYLTYPSEYNAMSNMPGEYNDTSDIIGNDPNLVTTHFETTGVMPTYLVAFIVSNFTCTQGENIEIDAVPYRVCSTSTTNLTRTFAVQYGVPLLRSLNSFTNYTYSRMGFPKMDQVAIPDFAAGAMENWGLVTYREQYLLWDEVESTNMDQQIIATIISHEYAHQWFGNLVTMEWWSETFLNEGFATYFEYFTTHDVFPEWELDKQWVVRVHQRILESDSLETSQALQAPANSDAQVMARFGQVSYLKGGSIFRMVEQIMGTENFIQGLRSYLEKFEFQNTLPNDLWDALDEQLNDTDRSRLPFNTSLSEVMRSWVETPGYPILNVERAQWSVIIRQEGRFLLNGNDTTQRWYIPISYATNLDYNFENTAPQDWLEPIGYVEVPFLITTDAQWILINNYATGYFRVNYNNLWDPLIVALRGQNFSNIPEVHRASLVDDAFHLARANILNYSRTFSIIEFLENDTSHHAWFPAISGFNFLLRRVGQDSRLGRAISNHVLDLLTTIYSSVPWSDLNRTNHAYALKQIDILTLACRLGLTNCVNNALERFGEFRIAQIRPVSNLRSVVYCNGLRYGNSRSDWDLLWHTYNNSEFVSEKLTILSALGCYEDEDTLRYFLELSLQENSGIRSQDALSVFASVYSGSSLGLAVAFKFLQENHQLINERYQSMNALSNMIIGLAERFTTENEINELRTFIANGDLNEEFHSAATIALATAEANLAWLNENWEELHLHYGLDPDGQDEPSFTGSTTVPTNTTTPITTTAAPSPGGAGAVTASLVLLLFSMALVLRS